MSRFPPGFEEALYTSVGRLVVNWAYVEQSLDMWIAVIYQAAGGRHLENELPMALKRKVRFLRLCLKKIPALAPFSAEMDAHMTQTMELSETRHFVVHGVFSHHIEEGPLLIFRRLDRDSDKTMHLANTLTISGAKLLEHGTKCMNLAAKMIRLSHRLAETFVLEDQGEQVSRRL